MTLDIHEVYYQYACNALNTTTTTFGIHDSDMQYPFNHRTACFAKKEKVANSVQALSLIHI